MAWSSTGPSEECFTAFSIISGIPPELSGSSVPCNIKVLASTALVSGTNNCISPCLNKIRASNLLSRSLPNRGTGHSGLYKNWCVIRHLPNLKLIRFKNVCFSSFPVAPTTLTLPLFVFNIEQVAPCLLESQFSLSPSSAVTRGSAGVPSRHSWGRVPPAGLGPLRFLGHSRFQCPSALQ